MSNSEKEVASIYDFRDYYPLNELTEKEKELIEIETEKMISKKQCEDKNINISLIALDELEKIGFKKNMLGIVLSKLVEDVYHERKAFSSSDYFDLSIPDNRHYVNLVNYYVVEDEQFYRGLVAKAIGDSDCKSKNINDIVYGVVNNISYNLENNQSLKLEA